MNRLIKAELSKRRHTIIFLGGAIFLLLYNIWDITLTDFGFEAGWSFFLFQKTPFLLMCTAIGIVLSIGQDIGKKTIYQKLVLGYRIKTIYQTQILTGILEALILLFIDTLSIIVLSVSKHIPNDIDIATIIINIVIIAVSIAALLFFVTVFAIAIPNRILAFFIIIGMSLVLFQKGEELALSLTEPEQTIFYNDTEEEAPMENPLYISGTQREIYKLGLLISPYAQVQYEKFILFEGYEQKQSTSLLLKHLPYHFEFIGIGMIEMFVLYEAGYFIMNRRIA